jgi:HEAT repeat protein
MRCRAGWRGWGLLLLACVFVPAAGGLRAEAGDELEEDTANVVGSLHPFGVVGLPDAYEHAARGRERPEAIRHGLRWLAAHQAPDGSWRPDELDWCDGAQRKEGAPDGKGKPLYVPGVTGMVVAAFLGAGHTQDGKGPFAQTVRHALTWLVKVQDEEGCFGPRTMQQYVYNHAFGALAVVEAYAMTGDAHLSGPAQKALDFIEMARNPYFAWRYGIKPGDNDTSVTGCVATPLLAALRLDRAGDRAGLIEPLAVDASAFAGVRAWLGQVTDPSTGRVGYVTRGTGPARPQEFVGQFPGEMSEACTAIAVLLRQALPGWDATPQDAKRNQEMVGKGTRLMLGLLPRWEPHGGTIDLYYWYYATMALRLVGGKAWETWDEALANVLLDHQRRDGEVCGARGSWDPLGVWAKSDGGRMYATALALLMLETPDRLRTLPEDRSDLLEALAVKDLPAGTRASVLRGLGALHVPGAATAVAPWVADENAGICVAAIETLGGLEASREGAAALVRRLGDPRIEVRRAAARALASQGAELKPHLGALTARLGDEDVEVAAGAARALGASGAPAAADPLKPLLEKGDVALRTAAAGALFRLTGDRTSTRPVLVEGLQARRGAVRLEAATALEAMAPEVGAAAAVLRAACKDDVVRVRLHAAAALHAAGLDPEADVDVWITALDAPRARDRLLAMRYLQKAPSPKATARLARQLLVDSTLLRVEAARTLAAVGPGARAAAPALGWCAENGPAVLRQEAAKAYSALAMDAEAGRTVLFGVFDRKEKDTRLLDGAEHGLVLLRAALLPGIVRRAQEGGQVTRDRMLGVLARIGPDAVSAAPALGTLLAGTRDTGLAYSLVVTLGALGPGAATQLPNLEPVLAWKNVLVRNEALRTVAGWAAGSDPALALLLQVAGDADTEKRALRVLALDLLGGLGPRASTAGPVLLSAIDGTERGAREAAVGALQSLWPTSEPFLQRALESTASRARDGAARAVAGIGPEATSLVKPLLEILGHGGQGVRSSFGNALAAIGKPAVHGLVYLLRSDKDMVRAEAARVLGDIGPDAHRALGRLRRLRKDRNPQVRQEAGMAIDKIKPPRR